VTARPMRYSLTEHRAGLLDRIASPQHLLDAQVVPGPLLDLVKVSMIGEQWLGVVSSPFISRR
jgi:hypothetical protein